jgi:hypothetical protein
MRQFGFVLFFILSFVLPIKAERVLQREKYNIIITADTVCAGSDYFLTVDLKESKKTKVLRNGYPVGIADGKAYIKFKAAATSYDKLGISKQSMLIAVLFDKDSVFEIINYFVIKPPVSAEDIMAQAQRKRVKEVQDSLTVILYKQEPYKDVEYLYSHEKYFSGFAYYLEKNLPFKNEAGELWVMVIIDSRGKVSKYDIVKNTYKSISLQKIEKAIQSYKLTKDFVYDGSLKFSVVIYTVENKDGNSIIKSQF